MTVTIHEDTLSAFLHGDGGPVRPLIERACIKVQAQASRLCPVRTGRLRDSIGYQVTDEGDEVVGYVGTDVEYASYVEFGTYKMAAQPYLRPALSVL